MDDLSDPERQSNPFQSPRSEEPPRTAEYEAGWFDYALFGLSVLAIVVGLVIAPGVGLTVALVVVPVLIRSLLVFRRRAKKGLKSPTGTKARLVFGSGMATSLIYLGLAIVLSVWVFVGFGAGILAICGSGPNETPTNLTIYGLLGLCSLACGLWLSGKWVRFRWRQDTSTESFESPASLSLGIEDNETSELQASSENLPRESPSWRALALYVAFPAAFFASCQIVATVFAHTEGSWSTVSVVAALIGGWVLAVVATYRWSRKEPEDPLEEP